MESNETTTTQQSQSQQQAKPKPKTMAATIASVGAGSNSTRNIFTLRSARQLSRERYTDASARPVMCRLRTSKLYLRQEPRSDEKVRFTEPEMYAVARTVLFMHVFRTGPLESAEEIFRLGSVSHDDNLVVRTDCDYVEIVQLLDAILGVGFSTVCRKVVSRCLREYFTSWRYFPFGRHALLGAPSAADYLTLRFFVNARTTSYAPSMRFLMRNLSDHRTPQQGAIKELPPRVTRESRWTARTDRAIVADRLSFGGINGRQPQLV
jgi:hypothetical protein